MNARNIDFTGIAYLVVLGVAGFAVWKLVKAGPAVAKQVGNAVTSALNAINPANPGNIAASATNAAVQTASGEPDTTLGTKLWELLHPGTRKLEQQITGADQEDADVGRAMLDRVSSGAAWSTLDQEDRDLGAAMAQAGAGVPMQVSPGFTYQTRPGLNF